MKPENQVIEAYAQADEEQRLYMFLSYRDFRKAFMEIEAADGKKGTAEALKPKAVSGRDTSLRRAAACCWGWLTPMLHKKDS